MTAVLKEIFTDVVSELKPPERLKLDTWADTYRRIPRGSSPEPGNWSTDRTPYMREIMQSVSDPEIEQIVLMCSAQLGKTELELNICGYYAHMDPSPMMYLMPTLTLAEIISKDRLAPMIDATPVLASVFGDNKSRNSSSTILTKKYPGGVIRLCGANSPSSLSSSPVRILLADEVDRYPLSAASEGDPLNLAIQRTKNFWNRKIIMVSTPTTEGLSRIHDQFLLSNQKHRQVPCPHCDHFHELTWDNFVFDKNDMEVAPHFQCPECDGIIEEKHKLSIDLRGKWVAEAPENGKRITGYRINEFYSQFSTWSGIRDSFLESYKSVEKLKVWTNTVLGQVWSQEETLTDDEAIKARREFYDICPEEVMTIVAGVDTQDDALHYEIVGFAPDMQQWGLEYGILRGDPGQPELWERLHEKLSQSFTRPDNVVLNIAKVCIDSGGHYTQEVYKFCNKYGDRYSPIVGRAGNGKPIVNRPTKVANYKRVRLYTVGVDTCKELFLLSRLKQNHVAHGYCHYPQGHDRGYDDQYYSELTNVKAETRHKMGMPYRVFVDRGRVEAVDCRVYAMAALQILDPAWGLLKRNIDRLKSKIGDEPKKVQPKKRPTRKVSSQKNNRKAQKSVRKFRKKGN